MLASNLSCTQSWFYHGLLTRILKLNPEWYNKSAVASKLHTLQPPNAQERVSTVQARHVSAKLSDKEYVKIMEGPEEIK